MKNAARLYFIFFSLFFFSLTGYSQNIITTVAGGGMGGDGGLAVNAALSDVYDVYADDTGNFYIVELYSIRKVDKATGIIQSVAGTGSPGYAGDGGPADQAKFFGADAIAFDTNGDYYVADNGNHRIRKVEAATNIITTVAGNGTSGYSGDGGLATSAQIGAPNDIALDAAGNLYIADEGYVIRRVDKQTGIISTVAGNGIQGTWSNGETAAGAQIGRIRGICVDKNGNIYFADASNRKIGKIDPSGNLSSYCGTGVFNVSGDGGMATNAETAAASKLSLDRDGNLYFPDGYIRRIDVVTGIVSRVAGIWGIGFSGDGGPALQAQFNGPISACIDTSNNLYIADTYNFRVRKVTGLTDVEELAISKVNFHLNPTAGRIQISCNTIVDRLEVRNMQGQVVRIERADNQTISIDISDQPSGIYLVTAYCGRKSATGKIVLSH